MTRRTITIGLLLLWTTLWVGSFAASAFIEPAGDGFTRGLNRLMTFMGWQLAALIVGLILLWFRPAAGTLRWLTLIPVAFAGLLISGIVGLILWVRLVDPEPKAPARPVQPPTEALPKAAPSGTAGQE